ncbi:hypothetical protein Drorol1_Dr00014609 [Drosera rotundifolia]
MFSVDYPPPPPPPVAIADPHSSSSPATAPSLQDLKNTNFSIRGYVFAARSKDISASWPFSAKHLQLCLKNEVKDPLPPFQHLPSFGSSHALPSCTIQLIEKLAGNTGNNLEPERTASPCEGPFVLGDRSLASDSLINSGRDYMLGEPLDLPDGDPVSLTREGNNLESERTASPCKPPPSTVADGIDVTPPAAGAIPAPSNKKRCRLVFKIGRSGNHKPFTEDITYISEGLMATKICPVCQTFSSSSNTTLNAHIDHCLFAKPTPQPGNSELPKPRIKPRKIRLMSDIYETAHRCTLEDLDRRNGTHWAVEMNLHLQVTNSASDHGKNLISSARNPLDRTDDGSVYIDANGKKIRILSVPSDIPSRFRTKNRLKEREPQEKHRREQILSSKKKKYLGTHLRHLKLTPCTSMVSKDSPPKGMVLPMGHQREEQKVQVLEDRKRKKPSLSRMLAKTVSSKSSGFPHNKCISKSNHQLDKCMRASMLDRSEQLYFDGSGVVSTHVGGLSSSQGNPNVPTEIRDCFGPSHEGEIADESYAGGRKRPSNLILRVPNHGNVELLRKLSYPGGSSSLCEGDDSMPEEVVGIPVHAAETENWFSSCSRSSSGSFLAFSPMGMRSPSSSSKNGYLLDQSTVPSFQSSAKQNDFVLRSCLHNGIVRKFAELPSETFQRSDAVHDNVLGFPRASEIVEYRGGRRTQKKRPKRGWPNTHLGSDPAVDDVPQRALSSRYLNEEVDNLSYYEGLSHDTEGRLSCIMEIPNGGEVVATDILSKGAQSLRQSSVQANDVDEENQVRMFCSGEPIPVTELRSGIKHGILTEDGIGGCDVTEDEDRVAYCCKLGGEGSVVVYDPIPIPGPPGSYLPSPRGMESEVFQGNSSLTTSCMQFSHDQSNGADEDSLDSPISASSTISNFVEPKAASRISGPLVGPTSLLIMKGSSEFSNGSSSQVVRQQVARIAGTDALLDFDFSRGGLVSRQEGTFRLQSSGPPCSCSRKEGIPWDAAFDVQGLQLPMRPSIRIVDAASTETPPSDQVMLTDADCLQILTARLAHSPSEQPMERIPTPARSRTSTQTPAPPLAPADNNARTCADSCVSPSTLVLRLMGKNLMVANSVESPQAFDG